jgi:hypothetical protein
MKDNFIAILTYKITAKKGRQYTAKSGACIRLGQAKSLD